MPLRRRWRRRPEQDEERQLCDLDIETVELLRSHRVQCSARAAASGVPVAGCPLFSTADVMVSWKPNWVTKRFAAALDQAGVEPFVCMIFVTSWRHSCWSSGGAVRPVRERTKRWVAEWLFGLSAEPGVVFDRLGQRLSSAGDPDSLLVAVVETVTDSVRLPYAAIELQLAGAPRIIKQRGQPTAVVEAVEMRSDDRVMVDCWFRRVVTRAT